MKYADIAETLCRAWEKKTRQKSSCSLMEAWVDSKGRQWWTATIVGGYDVFSGSDPDPDLAVYASLRQYCVASVALSFSGLPVRAGSVEELALRLAVLNA